MGLGVPARAGGFANNAREGPRETAWTTVVRL